MTRLRHRAATVAFVATTTAAAVGVPASPAAASFGPIAVQATYGGTHNDSLCRTSTCSVTISSLLCEAVGLTYARVPFAGQCQATLTFTVHTVSVQGQRVCTRASGGSFTFEVLGNVFSWPAEVVIGSDGVASYTSRTASVSGLVDVGAAEGTVAPACVEIENGQRLMRGTFSYTRIF